MFKIWLFLQSLLNCWSVCNQTCFDSTASEAGVTCGKKWITAFKVKITAKIQNVSECLSRWYLLNCRTFFFFTKLGMVMQHQESEGHAEKKNCLLSSRSRLQWGLIMINIWLSTISSKLSIPLQPNLVWLYITVSQRMSCEKHWITAFPVKVRAKVQNVS